MEKCAATVAEEPRVQGWGHGTCVSPQPALALCRALGVWHGCFATAGWRAAAILISLLSEIS